MKNVAAWFRELGMEQYLQAFEDNDVDEHTLGLLTEADLADMGVVSVGHRRRLVEAIAALASQPAAPAVAPPRVEAEQRQLTVLYCQVTDQMAGRAVPAGSKVDPEERRRVIQAFHKACMRVVAEYDGYVANFFGDCVLAYFGWPRAHEDDAEGAVRAGLALVRLGPGGGAPGARVGIATGPVVVGNLIDEGPSKEQSAVGVAPNLAARLLALAAPGQVVVDEQTRRLLKSFAVQPLGDQVLKGIAQPVAAFAVNGERASDSSFDARRGPELAPMLGRDQELALLHERWARAQGGEGQALLLVGEAGIGKSRITRALLDACAAQKHWRVRWQCSPHHMGSALWPVIQGMGQSAGLDAQDSVDLALDKLEALAGQNKEATALYAMLLGLDGTQRYGRLEMTPQMLRERTLELLVERLIERTGQRPLLLVVEDAHWIDPSTLELLDRCLERIDSARMLILITSRPDNQPALVAYPSVTRLSLNRLSRAGAHAIATRLGGERLNAETLATIVAQSDGVPLFVEELTKAVLETAGAAMPASLHGSLMARLDRIPEAKEVAQIAACIGREFDLALVRSVAERPEAVAAAIDKLTAAGLIFRRGDKANPRFTFKHALVQEAAHESLLRSKRQSIHVRILEVLEVEQPNTAPEILAHHAERARLPDKAVAYWKTAGDAALAKSAYVEAAGCFSNAIRLIGARGDRHDARGHEFELQLQLGQACRSSEGYGAESTRSAFERAYELAGPGEGSRRFSAQYGLWAAHCNRAEPKKALQFALEALSDAKAGDQPEMLLPAHRIVAVSYALLGDFAIACDHFDRTMALLPAGRYSGPASWHGSDPSASCFVWLAWLRQIQGLGEQSDQLAVQGRSIVAGLSQVDDKAVMHFLLALRAAFVRDFDAVAADVEVLARLAAGHGLRMHKGNVDCLRGWMASASGGPAAEAVAAYEKGIDELTAAGARLYLPFFWAGLACALAADGRHDEASNTIEQALAQCEASGQGWCDAELWCVRGEVILRDPQGRSAEAVESFERGLAIARTRGAKLWEQRCAASLARVRADQENG